MPLIIPSNSQSASGYTIGQSIRFNDDDTAYMHRTPSSSGNRDKWTWSSWIKRGNLTDANATLFQAGDDSQSANYTTILFNGNSGGIPNLSQKLYVWVLLFDAEPPNVLVKYALSD